MPEMEWETAAVYSPFRVKEINGIRNMEKNRKCLLFSAEKNRKQDDHLHEKMLYIHNKCVRCGFVDTVLTQSYYKLCLGEK